MNRATLPIVIPAGLTAGQCRTVNAQIVICHGVDDRQAREAAEAVDVCLEHPALCREPQP